MNNNKSNKQSHRYTAKLTGNKRDIATSQPKHLLIDIQPNDELARDHCWVQLPEDILAPAGHQKPIWITFEAKLKPYKNYLTGEIKYTLHRIHNIQRTKEP